MANWVLAASNVLSMAMCSHLVGILRRFGVTPAIVWGTRPNSVKTSRDLARMVVPNFWDTSHQVIVQVHMLQWMITSKRMLVIIITYQVLPNMVRMHRMLMRMVTLYHLMRLFSVYHMLLRMITLYHMLLRMFTLYHL